MLDLKALRANPEIFIDALKRRRSKTHAIDEIKQLDLDWRALKTESDKLKSERNKLSARINEEKKAGKDIAPIIAQSGEIAARIKAIDSELSSFEEKMSQILLTIPNVPDASVPDGDDESGNKVVRKWGEPKNTSKDVLAHYDAGEKLGLLDFERGAKLSGSRFAVMYGALARLERAIAYFMLENASHNGYREAMVPYLVNSQTMRGTGQLPKFAEELYHSEGTDLWLIPTSEVPLVNLHAGEIIEESRLPLKYCSLSPCFRKEAGNYQKDIKGLIRQHQFNKVELIKFTTPENSYSELESLVLDAESNLQKLGIAYQTKVLCTGDMGFASAKTYDIEVWLPSQDTYREISSCSNCTDFQARRAGIKFLRAGKNHYVHTLNGSGLAVGRTMVAILENCQDQDGISIPAPLRDYMQADRIDFVKK